MPHHPLVGLRMVRQLESIVRSIDYNLSRATHGSGSQCDKTRHLVKWFTYVSHEVDCSFIDRDDEMDGVWEAPMVENPLCKTALGCGKWTPPMIPNPAYKGLWSPPLIENPKYRVYQQIFI